MHQSWSNEKVNIGANNSNSRRESIRYGVTKVRFNNINIKGTSQMVEVHSLEKM